MISASLPEGVARQPNSSHLRRCLQRGTEAGADGFVQRGVFDEMLLGGEFGEPEVEDGLGVHGLPV